jgi:hypothetical protein
MLSCIVYVQAFEQGSKGKSELPQDKIVTRGARQHNPHGLGRA